MTEDRRSRGSAAARATACIIALPIVLFLPLAASFAEEYFFDTGHIYNAFDAIGLADPLGEIYDPAIEAIRRLFD